MHSNFIPFLKFGYIYYTLVEEVRVWLKRASRYFARSLINLFNLWLFIKLKGCLISFRVKIKSRLSRSDVVYDITCPGRNRHSIGKTERSLDKRLPEHSSIVKNSAVASHFLTYDSIKYLANLNNLFDDGDDLPTSPFHLENLIDNNLKVLHSWQHNNSNLLLSSAALLKNLN